MTARLDLIAEGATAATRAVRFPDDEPLEAAATAAAKVLGAHLRRYDHVLTSPARAARETVAALGLSAAVEAALRDCDYGRWRGLAVSDVVAGAGFAEWLSDPDAAPHGGETLAGLIARAGGFLSELLESRGRTLAVTHASVIRAAIVTVLGAPPSAFWRIDIAPLCFAEFSGREGRWNLVALGSRETTG